LAPEVKVGDHIIFNKYSGTEIKIDGENYLIMRESDVLAIK
jgi:chaperonin GroES